jgi:hypothetical protein
MTPFMRLFRDVVAQFIGLAVGGVLPKIAIEFFKYRTGALSPAQIGEWRSTRLSKCSNG